MCGADDCERCFPRLSTRKDILPDDDEIEEVISDAEASGLINDAIDRVFEASVRGL